MPLDRRWSSSWHEVTTGDFTLHQTFELMISAPAWGDYVFIKEGLFIGKSVLLSATAAVLFLLVVAFYHLSRDFSGS